MDVAFATEHSPGLPNEDAVVATDRFAAVLDGATVLPGLETGCVHGPGWLARTLGGVLASTVDRRPLVDAVADAITIVRGLHGSGCDLTNPDSPSTTVAIVRERDDLLDYYVLCDSSIAFDGTGGYWSVTDDRTSRLPRGTGRHEVAGYRNRPGGFWIASTDPEAARHAVTGSVPLADLRRVAVLSDGAARLVEHFGRGWPELFALIDASGVRGVIEEVRASERTSAAVERGKPFDDATLAVCTLRNRHA